MELHIADAGEVSNSLGAPALQSVDSIEEEVRTFVLKKLERTAQPSGKLREALIAKGFAKEIFEPIIERFIEVGLIDDYALAKSYVEHSLTRKGKSRTMIARELREKGLTADAVNEAIATIDTDREADAANAIAEQKIRSLARYDQAERAKKLGAFLSRKGYASNVVWAAVRHAEATLH